MKCSFPIEFNHFLIVQLHFCQQYYLCMCFMNGFLIDRLITFDI